MPTSSTFPQVFQPEETVDAFVEKTRGDGRVFVLQHE